MKRSFVLPTFALLAFAGLASAASVIWTGATDMNWTQPDATSWNATYNSGDTANFTATGAGTVTIDAGGVTPGQVNITAGTYTFSGGSLGGSGGIAISGGGLTLTGSNSYDGVTAVSGVWVSLTVQNSNALGSTVGATTVADGSRINLSVGGLTIGENITIAGLGNGGGNGAIRNRGVTNIWSGNITASSAAGGSGAPYIQADNGGLLTISGNVDVGTRGLQAGGQGNITISGNISGSGNLTKDSFGIANTGTLLLTGTNNSYSGATTISTGTLQVGNGTDAGSLGNTSAITNNGSLVFNVGSGNRTVGVAISGTGSLTQNSSGGTLTLSGSNSYSGNTTVSVGTLKIGGAGLLGGGNYTAAISNNGTFQFSSTANQTLSGVISGSGGLTKDTSASSVLTLSGNNTFTGATMVADGTLKASVANALGSTSGITVTTGGTLLVSADKAIGSNTTITMNSTVTGNGTAAALVFSSTYNGTVGALTLTQNTIFDLGTDAAGVKLHFASIAGLDAYTLSVYNWTGKTLWEGGIGDGIDQIYAAGDPLTPTQLGNISFYSGLDNSSFVGKGFQIPAGSSFATEVMPVPEPATWIAMAALALTGGTIGMRRRSRQASINNSVP